MRLTDQVSFWAVGKDCCGSRQDFYCDDTALAQAHDAVVMLEPDVFIPEYLQKWGA